MEQAFGAIPSVLSGFERNPGVDEALVFAAWTRCAGSLLKTRTAPIEFFENRLVIAVQDQSWRRNLDDLSPKMLVKMNGALGQGSVKYIEFRIDKSAVDAVGEAAKQNDPVNVRSRVSPSLVQAAGSIADEKLREQFLDAAASYLANQERIRNS